MDIDNLQHIRWACRRGMLELDLILLPFFENQYQYLSAIDKQLFIRLLEEADPDLLNWLLGHAEPSEPLTTIVHKIRQYTHEQLQT